MNALLTAFITESRDLIENANDCLLALEKDPQDSETINELFRAVHTIKGSSGIFDIEFFTTTVHAAEDLLDYIKDGEQTLNSEHVDLLLQCLDFLAAWLDELEHDEHFNDFDAVATSDLCNALRQAIPRKGSNVIAEIKSPETESRNLLNELSSHKRRDIYRALADKQATIICFEPDPQCFFSGLDPVAEFLSIEKMDWMDISSHQQPSDPDSYDPYHCDLIFYGLTREEQAAVFKKLYHITDQLTAQRVTSDELAFAEGKYDQADKYSACGNDLQIMLAEKDSVALLNVVESALVVFSNESYQTDTLCWIRTLATTASPDWALIEKFVKQLSSAGEKHRVGEEIRGNTELRSSAGVENPEQSQIFQLETQEQLCDLKNTIAIVNNQKHLLSSSLESDYGDGILRSVMTSLERLSQSSGDNEIAERLNKIDVSADLLKQHDEIENTCNIFLDQLKEKIISLENAFDVSESEEIFSDDTIVREEATKGKQKDRKEKLLRVDQSRIDKIMDLVGELVVAKNSIPYLAKKVENEYGCRDLTREIKTLHSTVNRISDDLQSAVMQVRMIPVNTVFQRFPRLVRDLSRKLEKNIDLLIEGEDTEADKNIIEELSDPLIHIVRNSIDHGIEMPEERKAAGKSKTATLTLKATQFEDRVVIDIIDDGRGIDPIRIKQKALEKKLLEPSIIERLSDQEVVELVFEPGFSTNEAVSDLSGRGVGMDVVRSVLNKAGGTASIKSKLGEGTQVRLTLPLSMAISRVLMIECAGQSYGINFDSVKETIKIEKSRIIGIKQSRTVVIRDKILPLYCFRELMGLGSIEESDAEEYAILIVKFMGYEAGIIIDDFQECTDVIIKPLEGILASYPLYSGTALLGDGSVLMIINLNELFLCQ